MLHGSETWAPTKDTTARLVRNDRAMLRWMYNTKPNQEVSKQELMEKFNIAPLENMLRANRLSWYGHVERSSGWINRCRSAPKGLADPRRPGMKLYRATEKPGTWWMQTHKTAPLGDIGCVKPRTARLHVWKMRRKPGYVCMYGWMEILELNSKNVAMSLFHLSNQTRLMHFLSHFFDIYFQGLVQGKVR